MGKSGPSLVAAGLICVSVWIMAKQRRAASCPLHERRVGQVAMAVAAATLLMASGLLAWTWLWL